jgi:hypothetical protein
LKSKFVSILLALSLMLTFASPVWGAESKGLVLKLKVGSTDMKVNGQSVKIAAPYSAAGTVMVPTAVFIKGLGAKLTLKNTKVITLTYPKFTVVLTVGSKAATVNGKKLALSAAPVVKSGVTFAPLKVLESFGAKVKTDSASKTITVTLAAPAAGTGDGGKGGSVIDSDAGKSKIGDSNYQWSMSYPTGLVQDYQSDDGEILIFRDVKNDYYLGITVSKAEDSLTTDEKRELMYDFMISSETIMDKRTVSTPTHSYEKIVSKGKNGFYFDNRGIQANGYFYVLTFGKKAASMSELAQSSAVLDSFRPVYDRADTALKDLSKIRAGFKTFKNADYGLTLSLPKEWTANEKDYSNPYFETEDAYLETNVTSLVAGDTLDAWVQRETSRFKDTYIPEARTVDEPVTLMWNGIPARLVKISYANDLKNFWHNYQLYAIQGSYRYSINFGFASAGKVKYSAMYDSIISSLKVDFSVVEKNFGIITDDTDLADWSQTVTKTSRKFGYSLALPEYWTGIKKDFETEDVQYEFPGGSFTVNVFPDSGADWSKLDAFFQDLGNKPDVKILSSTMTTFAGVSAKKVVFEDKSNKDLSPNVDTSYIIEKNGHLYVLEGWYYLANATDSVKKKLDTVFNSFTFTN